MILYEDEELVNSLCEEKDRICLPWMLWFGGWEIKSA